MWPQVANQLASNSLDPAQGRQLPLHIGSKARTWTPSRTSGSACADGMRGRDPLACAGAHLLAGRRLFCCSFLSLKLNPCLS
eukprot:1881246-Pleurochrysis_carterae.AAC.1